MVANCDLESCGDDTSRKKKKKDSGKIRNYLSTMFDD